MSNSLVIAAVTDALRGLLQNDFDTTFDGVQVLTRAPDRVSAVNGNGNSFLNLFLYHAAPNAHWRNMDIPWQVKPGETGHVPLALNLYYLLSVYSADDDERIGHTILGRAMGILHDRPELTAAAINAALSDLSGQALSHEEAERVRITPVALSLDEMSKLWSTFQTQYRLSAAYEVAVVLIESEEPATTPLPVLTRGEEDRGVHGQASLEQPVPPFPAITGVEAASGDPSAEPGGTLVIRGYNLDGDDPALVFRHPLLDAPLVRTDIAEQSATEITFDMPDESSSAPWEGPPGTYRVGLAFSTLAGESEGEGGPSEAEEATVTCPGFLPSRLVIGARARCLPPDSNNIRAEPELDATFLGQIDPGELCAVIDGPSCDEANNIAWWQVRFGNVIGWTAEGQADQYWLAPEPAPTSCPGFQPPRLVAGQRGRITTGSGINLRTLPSTTGTLLTTLPTGTEFDVLAGPVCDAANSIAWWRVDADGAAGWMAEGQGSTYWTEPLPPAPEPPAEETIPLATNEVSFDLAPKITAITVEGAGGDDIDVTLAVTPDVWKKQQVFLLFGNRAVLLPAREAEHTGSLTFRVTGVAPGTYLVRLRVDGVDSLLIDRSVSPPVFKDSMKVVIE